MAVEVELIIVRHVARGHATSVDTLDLKCGAAMDPRCLAHVVDPATIVNIAIAAIII